VQVDGVWLSADTTSKSNMLGKRYVNVFEIAQTQGEELKFGHSEKVTGNVSCDTIQFISPLPVIG